MADEELENSETQDELDMSDSNGGNSVVNVDTTAFESKVDDASRALKKQVDELNAGVKAVKKMVVILGATTLVLLLGAVGGAIFMTMGNGHHIHTVNENVTLVQEDLKRVIIASEDSRQASLDLQEELNKAVAKVEALSLEMKNLQVKNDEANQALLTQIESTQGTKTSAHDAKTYKQVKNVLAANAALKKSMQSLQSDVKKIKSQMMELTLDKKENSKTQKKSQELMDYQQNYQSPYGSVGNFP